MRTVRLLGVALALALAATGPVSVAVAGPTRQTAPRAPVVVGGDGTQLALFGRGFGRSYGRYRSPYGRYRSPYGGGFGSPYRRRGFGRGFFHGLFWGWVFSHFFGYGFGFGIPFFPILMLLALFALLMRRRRRLSGFGRY